MAAKYKYLKNRMVATLVTENRQPCVFCQQDVDDEVIYGKLYALGDIQCHYLCALLSCCLVQKAKDTDGLFGFLYKDILAEVERSKKHKCSYCGRGGANLGCCVSACRKQFHLPCGRRKNAVSLFYGNYKSFCELHTPKQKISDSVMAKAKERMKRDKMIRAGKVPASNGEDTKQTDSAMVCVICYEEVQGYPTTQTFWPPCCGRDAWLHRTCLQRMALSAGMHYLKCPLCNDKETFHEAVTEQGYYLPDRDAAWELEQNAFSEMYSREVACAADHCRCPHGRSHDEPGAWDLKLCVLCGGGGWGLHARCGRGARAVCGACRPAAGHIERLEAQLAAVIAAEQAAEQQNARSGPVMPSRMSLRRTKGRAQTQAHSTSSSSQNLPRQETAAAKTESQSPHKADRLTLNLKPPRRPKFTPHKIEQDNKLLSPFKMLQDKLQSPLKMLQTDHKLLSPLKMLEQTYLEKGGGEVVVTSDVIEKIRSKFSKPRPLSAKKKIANEILDDLFKNVLKENLKSKDPVREWNSPKKSFDATISTYEESKENVEQIMNKNQTASKVELNFDKDVEMIAVANSSATEISKQLEEILEKEIRLHSTDDSANESNILNKLIKELENDVNNYDLNVNKTVKDSETVKNVDEPSNTTSQLQSEIIPEIDDLPIFDTPKKLKTVDMQQDSSIEISEYDEKVNINVVQIGSGKEKEFIRNLTIESPIKNKMCSFKFSPTDKETLETTNVDIDVESFKDQYLNEVGKDFRHKQVKNDIEFTPIGLTKDAASRKRKLEMKEIKNRKKKLKLKMKIKMADGIKDRKRGKKLKRSHADASILKKVKINQKENNIDIKLQITGEIENAKNKKRSKKFKKMKENKLNKVSVKIRLKESTKIKKSKKKKVKQYKQYILKYSPIQTEKVIAKPEMDVSPIKRKYIKQEKPCDKLVQTSIQSFFKPK